MRDTRVTSFDQPSVPTQPILRCPGKAGGLALGDREYGTLLKGLVGRVRDVEDGVVDAAVDALGRMYRAGPEE